MNEFLKAIQANYTTKSVFEQAKEMAIKSANLPDSIKHIVKR